MNKQLLRLARKISTRMQGLNYLHRGVVLTLDIACSTLAGILSMLISASLLHLEVDTYNLLAAAVSTALYSTVIFLIFRFYKVIIRHASLRSLPRIVCALGFIAAAIGITGGIMPDVAPGNKVC